MRTQFLARKFLAKLANPNVWPCLISADEFLHLAGQIPSNLEQEMGDLAKSARFAFQCGLAIIQIKSVIDSGNLLSALQRNADLLIFLFSL